MADQNEVITNIGLIPSPEHQTAWATVSISIQARQYENIKMEAGMSRKLELNADTDTIAEVVNGLLVSLRQQVLVQSNDMLVKYLRETNYPPQDRNFD